MGNEKLKSDCKNIESYNLFINILKKYDLTIDNLVKYGLTRTSDIRKVKSFLKGKHDDKTAWSEIKKNSTFYYLFVVASPDVAFFNKNNISRV